MHVNGLVDLKVMTIAEAVLDLTQGTVLQESVVCGVFLSRQSSGLDGWLLGENFHSHGVKPACKAIFHQF